MPYSIESPYLSSTGALPLSDQRGEELVDAQKVFREVLFLEEKFDVVFENYYELERELVDLTLRAMLRNRKETELWDGMNLLNRRMINLLTSCRLYIDHSAHHISEIFGRHSEAFSSYECQKRDFYDSSKEYRFFEALRNYVQHRGYPIHGFSFRNKRIDDEDPDSDAASYIEIAADLTEIGADGKFKKSVLDELVAIGTDVPLKQFVRVYLGLVGKLHIFMRDLLHERLTEAKNLIADARADYVEINIQDDAGIRLAIYERGIDGQILNRTYIIDEFFVRINEYKKINEGFEDLKRKFLSGRSTAKF